MPNLGRRDFLKGAVCSSLVLATARHTLAASDSRVEILLEEPIGHISPNLYGHFTEHIGGVIYDGIWVGEDSKIPNIHGIRKALVDDMLRIHPTVVRWPGGCFADSYNWRDGIGPRGQRPRRPNFWIDLMNSVQHAPDGLQKYDNNHFGTHEFVQFCRLIGADPYLAVNVRSQTPREFDDWVDYCNAPVGSTTLADRRAENGAKDPFRIRYWGIGNESWGCGGNFTPEDYASEYLRFTTWVPHFDTDLAFIAAGPNGGAGGGSLDWTRGFFSRLLESHERPLENLFGWALHYYCGTSGGAIDFDDHDWYELLSKADEMRNLISRHWEMMGEFDKDHHVKLVVDEWGAWHHEGTEVDITHLFGQTSTMRDALIAGLTLDTFNRNADKVAMANVAQLINNLHSLFLAHEDRFIVTPNFHVFEMYTAHQDNQAVRAVFSAPEIEITREGKPATLWGLAGSASVREKQVVVTLVNPSVSDARDTEITVRGTAIRSAKVRTLAEPDIHAHNSFDHPDAVVPRDEDATPADGVLIHRIPPASVVRMILDVA
jgi:alpha-N-arabinofuranosidase